MPEGAIEMWPLEAAGRDVSPGGDLDGKNGALYVFVTREAATPTSGCLPLSGCGR